MVVVNWVVVKRWSSAPRRDAGWPDKTVDFVECRGRDLNPHVLAHPMAETMGTAARLSRTIKSFCPVRATAQYLFAHIATDRSGIVTARSNLDCERICNPLRGRNAASSLANLAHLAATVPPFATRIGAFQQ
jgi:hypothetical protein